MLKFVLQRIGSMILTLLCIITITFFLMHSVPGGPFTRERPLPEAIVKALNEKFNLDAPLFEQYTDYLFGLLQGDMGPSFQLANVQVTDRIMSGLPHTAKIGGVAIIVVLVLGIPLGVIAALKQNKPADSFIMFITTFGVCIPSFVLAMLLIYVFAIKLPWFPVISSSLDNPMAMVLPVLAVSGYSLSFIVRLMRSSMLDVTQQDYVRTARAKGISEVKVIMKHAFKNAVMPVVTYIGPMIATLLTGSFVIEKFFTIPGVGRMFVESISNRDYTMIMGVTIFDAVLLVIMTFIVDIIYMFVDPRIRMGGESEA